MVLLGLWFPMRQGRPQHQGSLPRAGAALMAAPSVWFCLRQGSISRTLALNIASWNMRDPLISDVCSAVLLSPLMRRVQRSSTVPTVATCENLSEEALNPPLPSHPLP